MSREVNARIRATIYTQAVGLSVFGTCSPSLQQDAVNLQTQV